MHIVVLDDEEEMARLILEAAQYFGWEGDATTDPEAFLRNATEADVVVIDLKMPDVDGVEVLRRLGMAGCEAEIVLASGMDRKVLQVAEDLARTMGLHTLGHLAKPFQVASLGRLLAEAGKRSRQPTRRGAPSELLSLDAVRSAARQGRVVPLYQLQVDLLTDRPVGCEVLMRLMDDEGKLVSPDRFIPVAEENGLIDELTDLLFEAALSEYKTLAPQDWHLSFNISPTMLSQLSLPDRLLEHAVAQGFPTERITVEITESGVVEDQQVPLDILSRLRIKGFLVSIDDYGTGFSSLSHLRRFPATEMKIDQMFVRDMLTSDASNILVRKTIELGHSMGLTVVAEGIETTEQRRVLAGLACDIGQGYVLSRPLPLADLLRAVGERSAHP